LIVQSLAVSAPFDPRPENNAASVVTTVTQLADLSITKTGPTTAVPGGRVTYALTVANAGPSAATAVTVDDPTPAGLTLVSTSGDCTTAFPCNLGTMPPGTTRTIAATYTVARGTAAPPDITNAATVLSGISDPNTANNSATIRTRVASSAKCDFDGDGVDEIVTGAGPFGGPHVRVLKVSGGTITELASFYAYDPKFTGGVSVACGDVTGDGVPEIITGAGPGGGPHVRAFSLVGGVVTEVASFYAYDPAFTGGVDVAAGDLTGDGVAEIITGAGPSGGPHVRAFSLAGGVVTEVASFYAYDPAFAGGVHVAAADLTGDGVAEIITGAGPSGGPHVRVIEFNGGALRELASFYAYDPAFRGGVYVAAGDTTGDGVPEIITGAGPSGGPHVRVIEFNGGALREVASFYAYNPAFVGGVSVASGDVTGDGIAEVITGAGAGGGPHVRVIDLSGGSPTEIASFYAYDPAFIGGVRVASVATPRGEVALAVASGSAGRALNGHDVSMALARINDSLADSLAGPSPSAFSQPACSSPALRYPPPNGGLRHVTRPSPPKPCAPPTFVPRPRHTVPRFAAKDSARLNRRRSPADRSSTTGVRQRRRTTAGPGPARSSQLSEAHIDVTVQVRLAVTACRCGERR
jgi:uncharacterized repeat protein (TIGR01451 family)